MPMFSPQATRLRVPLSWKNPLQVLNHTRTTLSLCSNYFTTRDPQSLNPFLEVRRREEEISLERDRLNNEALK